MRLENIFGAFDGMSGGQLALNRAGIEYETYYASEINQHVINVAQQNYPNTVQLGSIIDIRSLPEIDLMLGGSPCQGFSFAGKQLNFEHPKSKLFFEFVRLFNMVKPKWFLLENVKMKQQYQDIISSYLGVKPIEINSQLVSAQHRRRLYWTNIPNIEQPDDMQILLEDILENNVEGIKLDFINAKHVLTARNGKEIRLTSDVKPPYTIYETRTEEGKAIRREMRRLTGRDITPRSKKYKAYYPSTHHNKANCLLATPSELDNIVDKQGVYRALTIIERERLQTIPDNYTQLASPSQRKKMIGNGWTIDVIAHILRNIPE